MQVYREIQVSVDTTGSAGSAVGTGDSEPISGEIVAVGVAYHASAPNTTTVDLDEVGGLGRKILDKAASNTSAVHYPRQQIQDETGTDVADLFERVAIPGRKVRVTVANSDALVGAVVATILVRE